MGAKGVRLLSVQPSNKQQMLPDKQGYVDDVNNR